MVEPHCFTRKCQYFQGAVSVSEEVSNAAKPVCRAFPEGIPNKIAYGDNKHTQPVEGDNGIQYERSPE